LIRIPAKTDQILPITPISKALVAEINHLLSTYKKMTPNEQIAEFQAIRDAVTAYTESMYSGNMDWPKLKGNR